MDIVDECLMLSTLAYTTPSKSHAKLIEKGYVFSALLQLKRDTEVLIATRNGTCYVAFRGTETTSFTDIASDANFMLKKTPCGLIHRGFYSAVSENMESLLFTLNTLEYSKLYVTGHSLGGALAIVFSAAIFYAKDICVDEVITFGQPRVGDVAFSLYCDERFSVQRYINKTDVVPRLLMFYSDVGSYVHMKKNGKFTTGVGRATGNNVSWICRVLRHLRPSGFSNHGCKEYRKSLDRILAIRRHNLSNAS
jgi:predicted lipase